MKKLIVFASLIFVGFQAQGQVRFGLKGGMNMSSVDVSTKEEMSFDIDISYRFAFHVGGFVEIPVSGLFSVQPELLFSSKGMRFKTPEIYFPSITGFGSVPETKEIYTPCYIELPVYLKAGFKVGAGKFIVGVGPYIVYGVCGKYKTEMKWTRNPDETIATGKGEMAVFKRDYLKLKVTSDYPPFGAEDEIVFDKAHLKRFDFGFTGFAGYELNCGFFVTAGFQKGLYNIDNFDEKGDKMKNKTILLSVGYKF